MGKKLIGIVAVAALMLLCLIIGVGIGAGDDEVANATPTDVPVASTKAPVIVEQPTITPKRAIAVDTIFDLTGDEALEYLNGLGWGFYWDYEYDTYYDDSSAMRVLFSVYTEDLSKNGEVRAIGFSWMPMKASVDEAGIKSFEFVNDCGLVDDISNVWDQAELEIEGLLDEAIMADDLTARTTWYQSGYEIHLSVVLDGVEFEDSMVIIHVFEN